MDKCDDCGEDYTEDMDGWPCVACGGGYCANCFEDHACRMQRDEEENDQLLEEDGEDVPDWLLDAPLEIRLQPETNEFEALPEEIEVEGPPRPAARGLNVNAIDEDFRKIGVATWNLHGLNDRCERGEAYGDEIANRQKALGAALNHVIGVIKGIIARPQPLKARLRKSTQKKSPFRLAKTAEAPKLPATDEEVAAALAANIRGFWDLVLLRDHLKKLNQAPARADIQDLLARLQRLAGAECSVATAAECIILRTRVRRIVGSENAWKKACDGLPSSEQQYTSVYLSARKDHPLCGVLDALANLDQSLNTHLIVAHINQVMAKNPWLDAFILQEVRPEGLKVLQEQLDKSLRITFGPCMAGVATKLNQREYYPVVTRTSTISKVTGFAIACVKDQWTDPKMPKSSKAKSDLWKLEEDDDLEVEVYRGTDNDEDSLDTINILWSKACKVYRPVVVYELTTKEGAVTIGNVHTSPGEGDNEWWRYHEYDQLDFAFDAGGKDGFWLMGGDYYLSAEARVRQSNADQKLADLDDSDTYDKIVEHYEAVTGVAVQPATTKKRKMDGSSSHLTVGQAQLAVFSEHSKQQRPDGLQYVLNRDYGGEMRNDAVVPQPFADDFNREVNDLKRLDGNQASEDIFRNVLGLTFEKTLPAQWKIAQAISGTNTHLKIHDFPAYATSPGKIRLDRIERARRFTRARVTSKMRIADFFIYNDGWRENDVWKQPVAATTLANRIGLLAPIEVGSGSGIHWYDEENLAISRYWMAISDHFPVAGVFTTDPKEPVLRTITAAPFVGAPVKASALPPIAPDSEADFELWPMPQDGDCFFECLKADLDLDESVDDIRQHALLEDSKLPKTYVGWPDWEAVAQHYGVTVVVHEYHYGEPDRFVGLLDEVNPGKKKTVHLRLIHIQDQSASHMDLLVPLEV